ncbi:MAG: RNA 2',3'-cyclic phosphodiesterase [Caulobacter sp.]|nr:RNA 2',3'-cyclic phosphodiesterase [Caulobacter sp.]
MIRLFAAVAIPYETARGLTAHQTGLEGARWRPVEEMHITLRFFGDVREDVAEDLDAELSAIAAAPFDLELTGAGHFGEPQDIHAVWAGVAESEPLRALHRRCETAARRAKLPPDSRSYRPHVTLAYLKRPDPMAVADWEAANNLLHSPPFRAARFGLYSSRQTREGSRYDLERDYPLRR